MNVLMKIYANTILRYSKLFSRKNMNKYLLESINRFYKKNYEVLNIGAGGEISEFLKKQKVKAIEIDIDKKRNPDKVMNVENMNQFKNESFDMIFCMEVLEHVKNPHLAVSEIHRVLKKGGIFVGSTPFVFPIHDEPYDYYRFTKYGIEHLFKEYKKISIEERNTYIESWNVLLLRTLNVGSIKQRLFSILLFPIFLLSNILLLLSFVVTHKQSTTGYFYTFKKTV